MFNTLLNILIRPVYASNPVKPTPPPINSVVGTIDLPVGIMSNVAKTGSYITVIIRFFIIIAGLFSLFQFLIGGFTYITSGGDKAKVQEAGQKITMSIIGLVVIAASFVIIAIISKLLFGEFDIILNPVFKSV